MKSRLLQTVEFLESKPPELGFHEMQAPEAWISRIPSYRRVGFLEFQALEAWNSSISISASLGFIKFNFRWLGFHRPPEGRISKIRKPRRGFFGCAENIQGMIHLTIAGFHPSLRMIGHFRTRQFCSEEYFFVLILLIILRIIPRSS